MPLGLKYQGWGPRKISHLLPLFNFPPFHYFSILPNNQDSGYLFHVHIWQESLEHTCQTRTWLSSFDMQFNNIINITNWNFSNPQSICSAVCVITVTSHECHDISNQRQLDCCLYSSLELTEKRKATPPLLSLSGRKPPINVYCPHKGSVMMTSSNGNIFRVTGPRWIPRTKASDAELWCFLSSAPD